MSVIISNIARNTSYFTLALILQKIISFSYFAILARSLGPEDLGKYYFAISFTTIFAIFIDLGLANVLTRETAKSPEKAKELLGSVLILKFPLAVISLFIVVALANSFGYSPLIKGLIYLSSISMILDSFTLSFYAVSRGFHNLFFESVGAVIFQIIVISSGIAILNFGLGLTPLMWSLALASVFNFLYSFFLLKKKWGINFVFNRDWAAVKNIILIALPFGIFAILQRLYLYMDSVLLNHFAGDRFVGLYQVAFKIIFALQFLPMAFTASLYPAFSSYWIKNREQLAISFERALNYLIIISLPISVGIMILADKIVLIFKSGYNEAVFPLQIAVASIPFIFLMFPVGSLLNACDRQKTNTAIMAAATALSIAMNIFLIPRFQAVGAAWTVFATNAVMLAVGLTVVSKIIKYKTRNMAKTFLKSLVSVLAMGLAAFYLKSIANLFLVVVFCGIIYFGLLFILKGFKKEDIMSILESFRKKNGQIEPVE